jgi:ethanolamine ammonia-lyase small subunit
MMKTPTKRSGRLDQLQALTPARIGLERAGASLTTRDVLKFDRDHALARDAVHLPFDAKRIIRRLQARHLTTLAVHSAALDRATYLQRPDLGRRLDERSRKRLQDARLAGQEGFDLGIVVADGLSTRAIHTNAVAFLDDFLAMASERGWRCAPIIIASQARVAIADEIGEMLRARLSVILIGERPGLSASDSMGIYVTYRPHRGRTDAERNCISNIRPDGLRPPEAAGQLARLITMAFRLELTGVHLKATSEGQLE